MSTIRMAPRLRRFGNDDSVCGFQRKAKRVG